MTITIKDLTIQTIRKAMRNIEREDYGTTILVPGWGQIKKVNKSYAIGPLPEDDDSDILTDYSAWTYCWKEKWVLDAIARDLKIE